MKKRPIPCPICGRVLDLVRSRPTRFRRIVKGRIYRCTEHQITTYEVVHNEQDLRGSLVRKYLPELELVPKELRPAKPRRRAKSKPKVLRASRRHRLEL